MLWIVWMTPKIMKFMKKKLVLQILTIPMARKCNVEKLQKVIFFKDLEEEEKGQRRPIIQQTLWRGKTGGNRYVTETRRTWGLITYPQLRSDNFILHWPWFFLSWKNIFPAHYWFLSWSVSGQVPNSPEFSHQPLHSYDHILGQE